MTPERWEQIGHLYDAAKELEPAERSAFLDQACGDEHSLRRELDALLAAENSDCDFLEAPALKDAAALLDGASQGILVGEQVDHYQILSFIGAGGMGEVYAARDSRLGRKVAIKLLPAGVAHGADRLRRFEQEAQAIAMLNHPNILTIHDVGVRNGASYIVSELLEGQSLREWINNEAIPMSKAVDYALQITRGLAAAHERGIVHRDLKPENVFITRDSRVKILDFGLAKLAGTRFEGLDMNGRTRTAVATHPGVVLGTIGYMAPEQLREEDSDFRVDIFAYGVLFYEMLTGERPFRGKSMADVMSAILKHDPPELPETIRMQTPGLERIIHRCLEKRPEHRFQSAGDLGFALEALSYSTLRSSGSRGSVEASPETCHATRRRYLTDRIRRIGWIVAFVFMSATILLAVDKFRRPKAKQEAARFSIFPQEKMTGVGAPLISPDGRRLAFIASINGKAQLWVRPMDSIAAQPLPGTEDAIEAFWSPDSQYLGFFAQNKLKKVAISGESLTTLGSAPAGRGGAWNRDDVILFVPYPDAGVHRVSAGGGSVSAVTMIDNSRRETSHLWPCFLPDGRHFLYFVTSLQREESGVYIASLDGRERKRLLNASSNAIYAPPGYLLFAREGALLAQPFDSAGLKLSGQPLRLKDQIQNHYLGKVGFSVSENGTLVLDSSDKAENHQLEWVDRTGKPLNRVSPNEGDIFDMVLSPDEKRVALTRSDSQTGGVAEIWLLDMMRGGERRFTLDPTADVLPVWSPDGNRIIWASLRNKTHGLYQKLSSGVGQDELLLQLDLLPIATSWSGDGRFILYMVDDPKTRFDLRVLPLDGERKPFPWAQTRFSESCGNFSPDSRWIAYTSDESGNNEIYVEAFQHAGGRWQISNRGGDQAYWRHDGKELFYLSPDRKLMAVDVNIEAGFEAGAPKPLFDLPSVGETRRTFAAASDGKKFLIVTRTQTMKAGQFTVVLNWTAGL